MKRVEGHNSFGGRQEVWEHSSLVLNCTMKVGVFLPSKAKSEKCPVLYWLSGLTCTEQNSITKAGAQQWAEKHGIIVVAPDTSPRGEEVANDDAYDMGQGAGFYINATQDPWAKHYQMFDYITEELPSLIEGHFAATSARSIFGHSMGGHGALICYLRKENFYKSVSAFAPIVTPTQVPWGIKVFSNYLGNNTEDWKKWDGTVLLSQSAQKHEILIDQGTADEFLPQLQPHLLAEVGDKNGHKVTVNMREGYDHSYYFISSFIESHFDYHAQKRKG